jgi:Fe-S-cluster containining protein
MDATNDATLDDRRDAAAEPLDEAVRTALEALYAQTDARARALASERAHWPCRRGCDHCCRHLAAPLPVSDAEWRYLWEGFLALDAQTQAAVRERVAQQAEAGAARPYTCPLLDPATGACSVYAHRPLACRTYGFALSRGEGLWCHHILALLEREGDAGLVWGNHDALEDAVRRLGRRPTLSFFEWFAEHPPTAP